MIEVGADEAALLFRSWVDFCVTGVRLDGIGIVVAPLGKMVGKLAPTSVGRGVLEVDNDELLVRVFRLEQRRLCRRQKAQNVAVLCLQSSC